MSDEVTVKDKIYVKTLGTYSINFQGSEISVGSRYESQVGLLLLIMAHFGHEGASRSLIKNTLFEDREVDDVSHAIRNVLYNMRQKFKASGLPDAAFVKQSKGVYYWTDEVEIVEDAREFEKLIADAETEHSKATKMAKLLEACFSYSGRFFAGRDNVPWIYQEGERYRALFKETATTLLDYYRDTQKYKSMYDLATYAVKVDPLAEWELYGIQALTNLGRYAESEKYYDSTIDLYIEEYGGRANEHVRDFIKRLGENLFHEHESIDVIQDQMTNPEGQEGRGYYCSLPVFQELYRIIERTMHRSADRIFFMLCTIVDSKGNPMREGPKLDDLSVRLKDAIINSIRHTDTVTKYGQGQYLILLINTTEENCHIIENRINSNFLSARQRTGVSYSVNSLLIRKK